MRFLGVNPDYISRHILGKMMERPIIDWVNSLVMALHMERKITKWQHRAPLKT
jgi:hypothetical protein